MMVERVRGYYSRIAYRYYESTVQYEYTTVLESRYQRVRTARKYEPYLTRTTVYSHVPLLSMYSIAEYLYR
jgi:hypothetical protein